MELRTYDVTITGATPLLHHADNVPWADRLDEWRKSPAAKGKSVAGDDRTPPWRWVGNLYTDGQVVTIPADNIMRCLTEAGAMIVVSGKTTMKKYIQSGLAILDPDITLLVNDQAVPVAPIIDMVRDDEAAFADHQRLVEGFGFSLFVKRVRIGVGKSATKHIRVRPRFDVPWSLQFRVEAFDPKLWEGDPLPLATLFELAGRFRGLCDWRPGAPSSPGPYGQFSATVKRAK